MNNFYNLTLTETSAALVVFSIILSFLLQLVIVFIYKKTHKGLSYSPSFVFTLVLIGVIGTTVMMVVQNNLVGAFALLGAFSIIRFRTILKETRDIAFVFFALVIGISVGTANYVIAILATALISVIILVLEKYNIGGMKNRLGFILTFNAGDTINMEIVKDTLTKHSYAFKLLQTRTYGVGVNSYVFSLQLENDLKSAEVVNTIKKLAAVSDVELVTGEHSVEY